MIVKFEGKKKPLSSFFQQNFEEHYYSTFYVAEIKPLTISNLKKERFIWAHHMRRIQPIVEDQPWQQEYEGAGHLVYSGSRKWVVKL